MLYILVIVEYRVVLFDVSHFYVINIKSSLSPTYLRNGMLYKKLMIDVIENYCHLIAIIISNKKLVNYHQNL